MGGGMDGFLAAVLRAGTSAGFGYGGKSGSSPAPFDAVDGYRLAGPSGSHPLAAVGLDELVRTDSDGLDGSIEIDGPVRVGEGIRGRIRLTAGRDIDARGAVLRLVGVRLTEQRRSYEQRDSKGQVTRSEQWVEVDGRLFETLPFTEPVLPARLARGQTFEAEFNLPAPRLGPPSAHLGPALLAWALDARWDIPMGSDEHVAALVDVEQHPDYLRSGAAGLAEGSLFDAWQTGDASIAVSPLPPLAAGSEVDVTVTWPSAGSGRGARLELQADVAAPNGLSDLVVWSTTLDPEAFRGGATVRVPIPADAPPTVLGRQGRRELPDPRAGRPADALGPRRRAGDRDPLKPFGRSLSQVGVDPIPWEVPECLTLPATWSVTWASLRWWRLSRPVSSRPSLLPRRPSRSGSPIAFRRPS